jgi:arylsulfatase A-like enzyme
MKRLIAMFALFVGAMPWITLTTAATAQTPRSPNIIVVMTDDQRWDTLRSMPNVKALAREGVTYTNAFVPNSLCCPSRVATLTGTNSHTNGVWGNSPPFGGFDGFDDGVSIATVLHDHGYRTSFVGKYLNGYPQDHFRYVPPGWDDWFAFDTGTFYDYFAAVDGRRSVFHGSDPGDYSGRVMTRKAISYIDAAGDRPFFLYFAPAAPHTQSGEEGPSAAVPDPRDVDAYAGIQPWRPASYGNRDPSRDLPQYLRDRSWSRRQRNHTDLLRQRQLESLIGVDRSVGKLLSVIPDNTIVVFMSDNGYLWGEHRWHSKLVPYEESIRIPLVIRYPHGPGGVVDDRLALNIDLVPTILGEVGLDAATPTAIDFASGLPVPPEGLDLRGSERRTSFPLEHWDDDLVVPGYCGIRTADGWMYARYWDRESPDNGFETLYDVGADPFTTQNLADDPASATMKRFLRTETERLCAPAPPFYEWGP